MIEKISADATFKVGDVSLTVAFQPKEGITAVVGPNGSGKTFTAQEALRYLFFGTKALRAALSTYETLEVDGSVRIHGQPYHIERGLGGATISHGGTGDVLAVGQDEVTKKVAELLGYGRDVFDLCNASVQGETQSLGALRPAQRKELIDRVLRVTDVRTTEKALREEANALKREAAALAEARPDVPEHPSEPEDYENSQLVKDKLEAGRVLRDQRAALERQIKTLTQPEAPAFDPVDEATLDKLREKARLEQQAADRPDGELLTSEQIDIAQARCGWSMEEERRGPKPTITMEELQRQAKLLADHEAISGMPDVEAKCPECDHEFSTRPPLPDLSGVMHKTELMRERKAHENWAEPMPPEPSNEYGELDEGQARAARAALKQRDKADAAQKEIDEGEWPAMTLTEAGDRRVAWNVYTQLKGQFEQAQIDNARIQRQLDDMDEVPDLDALSDRYHVMRNYEADMLRYQQAWDKSVELDEKIVDKQRLAEEYLEGVKQLGDARTELKSLLAPLLTREATALIRDMTNNKLRDLTVDEDMNIVVAGQPLETLSGAGKTVANIALRVALAKTLTGSAFPVFIGDEMDGDLDHERREATTQAMLSLKGHLKQIILITHKDVDIADHVVELGETA